LKFRICLNLALCLTVAAAAQNTAVSGENPTETALSKIAKMKVGPKDWPQWGGSYSRNNTPDGKNIPTTWDVNTGENIAWSMPLGSETYGNPVVANGKVFIGTNNGNGYIKRYPSSSTWVASFALTKRPVRSSGSTPMKNLPRVVLTTGLIRAFAVPLR
jgi:hypothetical protein